MRILGALLLCSALGQGAAQVNSITFEQNRGQSNPETRYIARCQGSAFIIEDNAIVFARSGRKGNLRAARLQFEGAGLIAAWQSLDPVTGTTSYIVGRDRTRWALDVHGPRRHRYQHSQKSVPFRRGNGSTRTFC